MNFPSVDRWKYSVMPWWMGDVKLWLGFTHEFQMHSSQNWNVWRFRLIVTTRNYGTFLQLKQHWTVTRYIGSKDWPCESIWCFTEICGLCWKCDASPQQFLSPSPGHISSCLQPQRRPSPWPPAAPWGQVPRPSSWWRVQVFSASVASAHTISSATTSSSLQTFQCIQCQPFTEAVSNNSWV